jgi:hypothetical protein
MDQQPLDGGAVKSFHAVLPAKTTEIRAITVYGATETYGVPPENLSADYDDLVAGKPVLFH